MRVREQDRGRLQTYLDELDRWNQRMNLTAVAREHAWDRHIGDTLALLDAVVPGAGTWCIDVGSGGGVPGVPLAILNPDVRVVLLDSDARKTGFLTHVCGLLGLDNVVTMAGRAEEVGRDPDHRERYDLAVSRATASPSALCELCLPLVRVGGRMAAILRTAAIAAGQAAAAARACGGATPTAPATGVLSVEKIMPCDGRYPRRVGVPGRRPL
jgi:16S rRNA (guanine527-N7)-methyltransferase